MLRLDHPVSTVDQEALRCAFLTISVLALLSSSGHASDRAPNFPERGQGSWSRVIRIRPWELWGHGAPARSPGSSARRRAPRSKLQKWGG